MTTKLQISTPRFLLMKLVSDSSMPKFRKQQGKTKPRQNTFGKPLPRSSRPKMKRKRLKQNGMSK